MMSVVKKKLCFWVVQVALLAALVFALAFGLAWKQPVTASAAASDEVGYHVGTRLNAQQLSTENYMTEEYTNAGAVSGEFWYVNSDTPTVYKAVFREGTKSAWIALSVPGHVVNAKIDVTNNADDESSWQTRLESVNADAEPSLPENPDCIVIKANADNTKHIYIDVTDLLQDEGVSPIYVKIGRKKLNYGNEIGIFDLLFFEGNVFDEPNTLIGAKDMANVTVGSEAVKSDGWFANSNTLTHGQDIAIAANAGCFFDGYRYGLWTMHVPKSADKVAFGVNYMSANAGKITVFANGKRVHQTTMGQTGGTDNTLLLTDYLNDYIGTDFRLTVLLNHPVLDGSGNGPMPKYLEFNFSVGMSDVVGDMSTPELGTGIAVANKVDSFQSLDAVASLEAIPTATTDFIENNNHVLAFYGSKTETHAYFDSTVVGTTQIRAFGIFKLSYEANAGHGYIKLTTSGSHLIKICGDEAKAKNIRFATGGDTNYAVFDDYATVGNSVEALTAGHTYYIDVSDFLNPTGGTLYLFVADSTVEFGNGAQLLNETELYTYSIDNTEFTAEGPKEAVWIGGPQKGGIKFGLTSAAESEGVAVVKANGVELDGKWSVLGEDILLQRSIFTDEKTYNIEFVSDKNSARTSSVSVVVKEDAVSEISVKTQPTKTSYEVGETLDFTGGMIELNWLSGEKTEVSMTDKDVIVSAITAQATAGTQTVTITYGDARNTIVLTVNNTDNDNKDSSETVTGGGDGTEKKGCNSSATASGLIGLLFLCGGAMAMKRR